MIFFMRARTIFRKSDALLSNPPINRQSYAGCATCSMISTSCRAAMRTHIGCGARYLPRLRAETAWRHAGGKDAATLKHSVDAGHDFAPAAAQQAAVCQNTVPCDLTLERQFLTLARLRAAKKEHFATLRKVWRNGSSPNCHTSKSCEQFQRVIRLDWVGWRPRPELNRGTRICSPLRHHSATRPTEMCKCVW